jgi:Arc/MetJ family transcription regulator
MEFEERRSGFSEWRGSQNEVDLYLKSYDYFHMKTTLDIPSGLLSEAMRLAGAKTKRAAVLAALDDFSKRGRMREMAMRLGDSETFMSAVDLETIRLQEKPE